MASMKAQLSPLFLAGIVVLGAGAAGDLAYHTLQPGSPMFRTAPQAAQQRELDALFGAQGSRAHLVTLVGMVITVGGVVQRGLSRQRR